MSYDNFMTCLTTCLTTMFVNRAPERYLAADCQLVSDEGRCQLRSAYSMTMPRQKDLQHLWRQMLCCCRSEAVELFASSSETNWH